tara:strand:+ start:33 stop:488 length:456 start_codon:yes stop_codon:yes gene_type:complete
MKIFRQELDGSQGNFKKIVKFSELKLDNLKSNKRNIEIVVNFSKNQSSIDLKGEINSSLSDTCDRCINTFDNEQISKFRIILTQKENLINDNDSEFILFDNDENEIDLSDVVRDTLLLEKPIKTICNKNCKGLCSNCGSNLNFEKCKCLEN